MPAHTTSSSTTTTTAATSSSSGSSTLPTKTPIDRSAVQSQLAKLQQEIAERMSKASSKIQKPHTTNPTPIVDPSKVAAQLSKPSSTASTGPTIKPTTTTTATTTTNTAATKITNKPVVPKPSGLGAAKQTTPAMAVQQKKPQTTPTGKANPTTIVGAAAIKSTKQEDDDLEYQISLQDYARQQETNQLQKQYQQQLLDHEKEQLQNSELANKKKKKILRTVHTASGKSEVWEDPKLEEFAENDFRVYASNLGNEITDQMLANFFSHYKSFSKAVVLRDKRTNRSRGYGFISFLDSNDYVDALENFDGKYLGNRPLVLKPSKWKDRNLSKY